MAKHIIENPEDLEKSVAQRHEHRDFSNAVIRKGFTIFVIFWIVSTGLSYMFIKWMNMAAGREQFYDQEVVARDAVPGGPLLQTSMTAHKDIADLRAQDELAKSSFRSIANDPDHVTEPIEKAMKEVAQQGLPNFKSEGAATK